MHAWVVWTMNFEFFQSLKWFSEVWGGFWWGFGNGCSLDWVLRKKIKIQTFLDCDILEISASKIAH